MIATPNTRTLTNTVATASAKLIDPVIQVARHSQQDPDALLAAIGIEPDSIAQAGARMPAALFSTLLKELALRTGNPRLALRIGEATQPRMLGSVGFLMSTAPNLGQAYQLLNDYLPLLIEGLHLSLEQDEKQVTLVLDLADDTDRVLIEWFLACMHNWTRWLTGKQVPLTRVEFTFPEPTAPQFYEQFFAAEVGFNADRNRLQFAVSYLELSCLDANEEMQRLHQTFADQLLSAAGRDGALVAQIKSLIRNQLSNSGKAISRQQVADQLNLSLRTMQRKLDQQGTHFQALFDQTRKDLAIQLIHRGDRSFGEIAYQLGFSSLSAFQKAFKRWTGMAPGSYRSAQLPKTLTPYRSQPKTLADLIGGSGLDEQKFYPLALQLLELLLQRRQRSLKRLLLSPARINIVTDDLLDYRLTLVDPAADDEPPLLERLTYEAPESSLALPYAIDDRSELYQLGALFYCLLHGQPPYSQTDPGELLQAHLQQSPQFKANLSPVLNKILSKLLAIPANERYQSINGLQVDLKQSQLACQQQKPLSTFEPGSSDAPEQITGLELLTGHEQEQLRMTELLQSMRSNGQLLFIEGPTGSGKSSLIESLRSPLFLSQGTLIKGGFDPSESDDIGLFIQLARQRLRHKLTLPKARRDVWGQRLLQQLGAHAALLQQLLPELNALLGSQSAPPDLGYTERKPLLIEALAKLFLANRDPLVIFIDDLQHAGNDGLKLIHLMIEQLEQQPLLLVISYNADQVAPDSPITEALQRYQYHRLCTCLSLKPLPRNDTQRLLQNLFGSMTPELSALADWLYQRTDGVPGRLADELRRLRHKHWLHYHPQQQCWQWQPNELPEALSSELEKRLSEALTDLPAATLELLQWAAVIGDPFELELLAEIRQDPLARVSIHLWPAQQSGLIQPRGDADNSYGFSHPTLCQALQKQHSRDNRARIQWSCGDALQRRWQQHHDPALLQRCVERLNQGYQSRPQPLRRQSLARLNLEAGRSTATEGNISLALSLYQQAYRLLDTAQPQHGLSAEIQLEAAELVRGYGNLECTLQWLARLQQPPSAQASTTQGLQFALAISKLQQLAGTPLEAIQTLTRALSGLDIELPQTTDAIGMALEQLLTEQTTAPVAKPQIRPLLSQLQLLAETQLDPVLFQSSLITLAQHSGDQPTYPTYLALLQLELWGQPVAARSLSNTLPSTAPDTQSKPRPASAPLSPSPPPEIDQRQADLQHVERLHTELLQGARLSPWISPLKHSIAQLDTLLTQARSIGQHELADACTLPLYNSRWFSGEPLQPLLRMVETEQDQLNHTASPGRQRLAGSATLLLRRLTETPNHSDTDLAETGDSDTATSSCPWALSACCALDYLLDNRIRWPALLAQAEQAKPRLSGLYAHSQLLFFSTLMEAELAAQSVCVSDHMLIRLRTNQALFQHWSVLNPQGFSAHTALIDAELGQLRGELSDQMAGYERALQACGAANCAPLSALAFERFSVFCHRQQQPTVAKLLLVEASRQYQLWGATAKLAQLKAN